MIFKDVLDRRGDPDPWDVSAREHGVVGGTQHDRDFVLLEAVTMNRFTLTYAMKARYAHFHNMGNMGEFIGIVRERYELRLGTGRAFDWDGEGSPWESPLVVERFMSEVLDCCQLRGVWFHKGWLKILYELRAEIWGEAVNQGGGGDHD